MGASPSPKQGDDSGRIKVFHHACPSRVSPELLLDRDQITSFSDDKLEEVIKASRVQHLTQLQLGLDFFLYTLSATDELSKQPKSDNVRRFSEVNRKSISYSLESYLLFITFPSNYS